MYSRRALISGCSGLVISTAGCSRLLGDEEVDPSDEEVDPEDENGDQFDEGTQAAEDETDQATQFTEDADTEDYILNMLQLPNGFSHVSEEVILRSELQEADSDYDRFEQNDLLRQHTNQFVENRESEGVTFISSTVFICGSVETATGLKQQRISAFATEGGEEQSADEDHEISTTLVKNRNDNDALVRVYLGQYRNAIIELLLTMPDEQINHERLYIEMVTNIK